MANFRIEILHKFNSYGKENKTYYPQVLVGDKYKYLTQKTVFINSSGLDRVIEYLLTDEIVIDGFVKTECHYHNAVAIIRHYQAENLPIKEQKITYEYLDL
jgi:hypothetical protein